VLPGGAGCGIQIVVVVIWLGEGDGVPGSSVPSVEGQRVRDLLRRCGASGDPVERAVLLMRVACELHAAAEEIAVHAGDRGGETGALVAALRGQAGMAGFMAELERGDWACGVERAGVGWSASFAG
jgi:hypothetical protein